MGPRSTIAAGLVTGVVVTVVGLGLLVAFLPDPAPAMTAGPTSSSSAGSTAGAPTPASPSATPPGSPSPVPTPVATVGNALFHIGDRAPALRVPQLGGGTVDLSNLAGRPVWVNFMQTTCPPCVDEFPVMGGFAARYASTGLVVVAIDVRESEDVVATFVQQVGAGFPVGLDADGSAQQAWDATALPVHFWIGSDGIIKAGALGGIGPDAMAQNLAAILPGVSVEP